MRFLSLRRYSPSLPAGDTGAELLDDYIAAEDALRAFTDRNAGRMCAICARWTLFVTQANDGLGEREQVEWGLSSVVTSCCNANHALESMSDESLSGVVASRELGREWWRRAERAAGAPCAALTERGCTLARGRPELCNRFFCEGVRDYLWTIGGDRHGPRLAAMLDELQRRWTTLYLTYQSILRDILSPQRDAPSSHQRGDQVPRVAGGGGEACLTPPPRLTNLQYRRREQVRRDAGWASFLQLLKDFDVRIASVARPVTSAEMTRRFFKVSGDPARYQPFFERELDAIGGEIRAPGAPAQPVPPVLPARPG